MILRTFILLVAVTLCCAETPAQRAHRLVGEMTLAEKIQLCQGANRAEGGYVGIVKGIDRLGVPDLRMNDGPQGFRCEHCPGTSTQWPSGLTVAHSWDAELFYEYGKAMGAEFYGKGANVQFGPALNVARIANGGRSFEYLSGEDPFLGYTLVQPVVRGIQEQGVIANAKHYINNNQEGLVTGKERFGKGDRHSTSEVVDERTQMELYFPPFEGAVEAGVLSVMCANNLVNGVYACENNDVMTVALKERAGFQGWVCSDYDGTRSTIDAANNGLDIAMPGPPSRPDFFGSFLLEAVHNGSVAESVVNDKAFRVVYSLAKIGALDKNNTHTVDTDVTSAAHILLARKLASAACILLKNEGHLLPLSTAAKIQIGVFGEAADAKPVYGGGGSGAVVPKKASSVFAALKERLGADLVVYDDGTDVARAKALAARVHVAIVVIAQSSQEGRDRNTLVLDQTDLVSEVAAVQNKTVVISVSPGPFLTPFAPHVAAMVDVGLPGEQEGNGIADVLFGVVSPSGKLPHTLPNRWNEMEMTEAQYPGVPPHNVSGGPPACSFVANPHPGPCVPTHAHYTEKLEVGYRWYDAHNVTPAFPFGHGLSYTTFTYANMRVVGRNVTFEVTNSGGVAGSEVAQLYVRYPPAAGEAFLQLRGFTKLHLAPGEKQEAQLHLPDRWLSVWNSNTHAWSLVHGAFELLVGSSSADVRLTATLAV